ncbi:leucyl aminopeptidase [bacterium]|nr:leucyl aminopeptidase [bacterium]
MTEITINQPTNAMVKIFLSTDNEQLNYGITGGLIDRSTYNKLKAFVSREDEINSKKETILLLDMVKEVIVLLRPSIYASPTDLQTMSANLWQKIKHYPSATVFLRHLPKTPYQAKDIMREMGLGFELSSYSFDKYHTQKKATDFPKLETINFTAKEQLDKKDYAPTAALANAVRYARDLTNEPSNELTPEIYANDIKRLEHLGLKVTIMNKTELKKKGFNMLLSVAQGSINEPYVCIIEYNGNKKQKGYDVALVGKGVTFDAGGISLKPANGMWDMKQDMAGSAVVVASLKAAVQQKLNLNLVGIVGLVENMPSGTATRPGDIVTSLSGKTVEILNTDAEGRLVLGDCLTYVEKEYKPERIIDIATLTGAIVVALGDEMAGLFSNDDVLSELLTIAGEQSGEELWRFPINDRYRKKVKSDIADLKNISEGRSAGSITAACFLENFLPNKTPWAHLDIAGMDMFSKPKPMYTKGASGFGVLLLNKFLRNLEK